MTRPVQHTAAAVAALAARGPARRRGAAGRGRGLLAAGRRRERCTSTTRAGSRARSPAAASRARWPPRRWRSSSPDGRAAARHLRDLRRAGRHGRADVRRHRPHLHPRAHGRRARGRRCCDLEATIDHRPPALITLLDGAAGRRQAVTSTTSGSTGTLGAGELLDKQRRARGARACWPRAAPRCATSAPTAPRWAAACASTPSIQAEPPRMVVFGAIDFSSALAPLAKGLGYRVTIADPRSAFLAVAPLLRRRRDRGRLARRGARRRRARPARRGADLHPRPEARRARRAGRAGHRAPATSARSAAATRPPTATAGCATSA